jgi:hypothetical protein
MSVSAFVEKLQKLNPAIDFSDIEKRIDLCGKCGLDLPVNVYHGSYFDLTNIAILQDIINERSCAPWLRSNREVQSLATQALTGIFFHTDVGHAKDGLKEMAQGEQPKRIHYAEPHDRIDSPFYVFEDCLHNEEIARGGANVTVRPLRVFDGTEAYLLERGEELETNYCMNDDIKGIIDSEQPHAYLITLDFSRQMRRMHVGMHVFECEELYAVRKMLRDDMEGFDKIFSTVNVIIFQFSTHTLARILMENKICVHSLYEGNDGDSSSTLYESIPKPLCDAKYLITGRGCAFESGHYDDYCGRGDKPHIIKDAWCNFNDYGFIGMAGKLEHRDVDRWGVNWNAKYFHGFHNIKHSEQVSLSSKRLIFKKLQEPIDYNTIPEIKKLYDAKIAEDPNTDFWGLPLRCSANGKK